jgi:hypothetical protein
MNNLKTAFMSIFVELGTRLMPAIEAISRIFTTQDSIVTSVRFAFQGLTVVINKMCEGLSELWRLSAGSAASLGAMLGANYEAARIGIKYRDESMVKAALEGGYAQADEQMDKTWKDLDEQINVKLKKLNEERAKALAKAPNVAGLAGGKTPEQLALEESVSNSVYQRQVSLIALERQSQINEYERVTNQISIGEYFARQEIILRDIHKNELDILDAKQRQVDAMAKGIEKTQAENALSLERAKLEAKTADAGRSLSLEKRQMTFVGGIDQWKKWSESVASAASIANATLTGLANGAISGISGAINGLIDGTKSWGQAWLEAGKMILSTLIQIIAQLLVVGAIRMMFGLSFLGLAGGGLVTPLARADGGLIPGAPSDTDNRLAMVATGEYVIPAARVKQFGVEVFDSFRAGKWPVPGQVSASPAIRSYAFAAGGLVGPGQGVASDVNVTVGFLNSRQAMREMLAREGHKIVVDQMAKRGNVIKG